MKPTTRTALKALGASAHNAELYAQTAINAKLLERIAYGHASPPAVQAAIWEHIKAPEFTCICPVTGQADFATIEIFVAPIDWLVESKSLKLYLGSFRNVGTFHETATKRIHSDLVALLDPSWCLVVGRFTPRGGIPFQPRVWNGAVPNELLYRA